MSEKIADFEVKHKGSSYEDRGDGKLISTSNWETEAEIEVYGAVFGTLRVIQDINNPDADCGECSWSGEAFMPDGTKSVGFQSSTWEKAGNHVWKLSMIGRDSKEGAVRTESAVALESLTWSGTVYRVQCIWRSRLCERPALLFS